MIRTKEEMLDKVNKYIGEDTSGEAIELIEDISDSYDSFSDPEDWKAKYEELDETWKKKYKDRFFEGSNKTPTGELSSSSRSLQNSIRSPMSEMRPTIEARPNTIKFTRIS